MARKSQGIIGILSRLSLGLILVLIWAWMFLRADILFPYNTEAMKDMIQFYIIFSAFIFSWDTLVSRKVETPIFQVSFVKAFPKFLIASGITMAILLVFGLIYQGNALPTIKEALSKVGLGVLLLHGFFVAVLEEKVFRNWVVRQLEASKIPMASVWIIQALIFAFFHYTMNRSLLSIVIYIPLGILLMYVRTKWSPKTDMANAGVHFAWNAFILGFLTLT